MGGEDRVELMEDGTVRLVIFRTRFDISVINSSAK